jgi:hypothetical protein
MILRDGERGKVLWESKGWCGHVSNHVTRVLATVQVFSRQLYM